MKHLKNIAFSFLLVSSSCLNKKEIHEPPYQLSNKSDTPVEFLGGKISTTNGISFSKDGTSLYVSKQTERISKNERHFAGIFKYEYKEGSWGDPESIIFPNEIDAYHPVVSPDNNVLFFNSRSHPDTADVFIPHNIWYSEKMSDSWSAPKMVDVINGPHYDSYPSIAKSNNLYFNSDRPGGKGGMDIYLARFKNGKYEEPVNLKILNSLDVENDLVIDPNEEFIIFNRYFNATKELDMFISSKYGNDWSMPQKLDKINARDQWELTPSISPDGEYFFYELNNKIMQIEMEALIGNINVESS